MPTDRPSEGRHRHLLRVRVPVLSEQFMVTEPSVSTAGSLRIMAFSLLIELDAYRETIVTMAGRPSGIAATASDTEVRKSSNTLPFAIDHSVSIHRQAPAGT